MPYFITPINLLPVEFETFAKGDGGHIGGARTPNWKPHKINNTIMKNFEGYYGDFEKCVAHPKLPSEGGLNMAKYLKGYITNKEIYENPDVLNWKVWIDDGPGQIQESHILESHLAQANKLELGEIVKIQIAPLAKGSDTPLDRLIVTVLPYETLTAYADWKAEYSGSDEWIQNLPAVYSQLPADKTSDPDSSCINSTYNVAYGPWTGAKAYSSPGSKLHPNATYDMRSEKVKLGIDLSYTNAFNNPTREYSHQACYKDNGLLIRPSPEDSISAGSADRQASLATGGSWGIFSDSHVSEDVLPFHWALQLDGNPAVSQPGSISGSPAIIPNLDLSAPIMYEGANLLDYIERRPAFGPAGEINIGQCQ